MKLLHQLRTNVSSRLPAITRTLQATYSRRRRQNQQTNFKKSDLILRTEERSKITRTDQWPYEGTTLWAPDDIHGLDSVVDGVSFMKAIINFFEQRRILNDDRPIFGRKFVNDSGKLFYVSGLGLSLELGSRLVQWRGEGMLILDNTEVYCFGEISLPFIKH